MSWPDKIEDELTITTGDSQVFSPLWVEANKSKEYNTSEFLFPNKKGSFIKRFKPKGAKYNLNIRFQGENNLENAQAFWNSADDNRPWRISHPLYGDLLVQPFRLAFDDSAFNVTRVTAEVGETNEEKGPEAVTDHSTEVRERKSQMDEDAAEAFATQVSPDSNDVTQLNDTKDALDDSVQGQFPSTDAAEAYRNAIQEANSAIGTATSQPRIAMVATQNIINAPARFEATVEQRLNILEDQFNQIRENVGSTPSSKQIHETHQSANLSAQCETAVTPLEPYTRRQDVVRVAERILDNYDTFTDDLVSLQSSQAGTPESYIPLESTQRQLASLIDFTTARLFDLAFGLKREKAFWTKGETNILLLAHKIYGLDPNDENLWNLMEDNNLHFDELLIIEGGRRIRYYA